MPDPVTAPPLAPEPSLRKNLFDPKGVMQKNSKLLVYLGVAGLVVTALVLSSRGKPASAGKNVGHTTPQPLVQDNTENNVADLHSRVAEQQRLLDQARVADPAAETTNPQRVATQGLAPSGTAGLCPPGRACMQPPTYGYATQPGAEQVQVSPAEQEAQQLAAKERERSYESRFSSNFVFQGRSAAGGNREGQVQMARDGRAMDTGADPSGRSVSTPSGTPADAATAAETNRAGFKRRAEVDVDSATGQPYVLFEGTTIDTVLMNRLDGDAVGPVKVLVSNPVYSHDRQHVLVPDGTVVLGEAKKIGESGFGQQRRMAVTFHRMIMPDGYSVDLDQFQGLDQIGEQGLKDKVNNHYLQIFGSSIALGVIAGAAQISQGGGVYAGSGGQVFTNGAAASVSQSATSILDRFMQIPPTMTIREGHRVKVYITQDMLLPAYERHTIPSSF